MTTFGTPLSPHATQVMLLGSGELGKEGLIALQRLGVETIATDRYDNAPGQQVAHHARTITMSGPAQLKALIEKERPHLVVPEIEAIATPMLEELEAAGVAEALRVPNTALRLFGKPESFVKRRMDVALAFDADVQTARDKAKLAASRVRPRAAGRVPA